MSDSGFDFEKFFNFPLSEEVKIFLDTVGNVVTTAEELQRFLKENGLTDKRKAYNLPPQINTVKTFRYSGPGETQPEAFVNAVKRVSLEVIDLGHRVAYLMGGGWHRGEKRYYLTVQFRA